MEPEVEVQRQIGGRVVQGLATENEVAIGIEGKIEIGVGIEVGIGIEKKD